MSIVSLLNHPFPPIGTATPISALPTDFAVMLVGTVARQAASPTAIYFQSRIAPVPRNATMLEPVHGAFNLAMARRVRRWKET